MKKIFFVAVSLLFLNSTYSQSNKMKTFFDFKIKSINGNEYDLAQLKGKKILVVNTASKCGNTPQYAELEQLYNKYKGSNFTIIGFPANNFGKQEPGTDNEIAEFCTKNYGVTFPMMSKISVKGEDINPVYTWLTKAEQNGVSDCEVKWNFQKFMIDENGKWVGFVAADETPLTEKIIAWVEGKN